ncbi:class I SAM-dependent methyltransferase [candidate division KSB1 bacterium]
MTAANNKMFWKVRSVKYEELEWAKDLNYLEIFAKAMKLKKSDFVLDVGTGTGLVANYITPFVKEVVGMDISSDMLEFCRGKKNMYFFQWDIRHEIFREYVFDKIFARMVLHHIATNIQKAINECYQVLKKGGMIGIAEGVPPTKRTGPLYTEIFKHKEKRRTFFESDLVKYLTNAGFKDIKVITYKQYNMSIRNWLNKSGLPKDKQEIIYDLHVNAPDYFKNDYNMVLKNNDCFVTFKNVIITGVK